jgi:hypothetical protein
MPKKLICLVSVVLVLGVTAGVANGGGLWGYYPINENGFDDYSGNGHHGTAVDGAATVLDADRGWVAAFNVQPALPSRVECGTDDPSEDGELSVSAWIKWEGLNGNWQGIAGKSFEYGQRRWIFQLRASDGMIQWGGSDSDNLHIFSTVAPEIGQWQHVAGTCDGSYSKVYINGEIVGEGPGGFSPDSAVEANVTLGFGEDRDDYDESFNGLMDEIYIYSRTLSDHQIMNLTRSIPLTSFTKAINDNPKNGAIGVPQDTALGWKPGTNAVTHDVYFGTVFDDVNEASRDNDPNGVLVSQNQTETTYEPPGLLEFGQSYYWRVDEFNDLDPNSPWKGDVWSFKVINYFIVDDFESYNDLNPTDPNSNRIFLTWLDGLDQPTNGAIVGYAEPPFAEQTIVHVSEQSMPLFYDNSGTATYSEVQRTFSPGQDWTKEGVEALSLWFRGYPAYVGGFVEAPAGTYTMTAAGEDIWSTDDEFHFAYKELSGAAAIIAKVESVENTDPWAKAGVMIRDTLEPDSRNVALLVTPENGVRFQYRNAAGRITDRYFAEGITAPQWVKLERTTGGLVRAFYSADGSAWTLLNMTVVSMNMPVYIGLAVTSHNTDATCEAKFSNVSFPDTGVGPQWTDQDVGMLSNEAEPMYVTVADGSGTAVTVYHDNHDAPLIDTWTQWNINTKEFGDAGVILTDVSKLAIGFGGADNPQPGGSGLMYFDDIRLYLPAP